MGKAKAGIDKLSAREDEQRTSKIVQHQPTPQKKQRMPAYHCAHSGAVPFSSLARHCAAQHIAPRVMDIKFPVEPATKSCCEQSQNEICFFSSQEPGIEARCPVALDSGNEKA